MAPQANAMPEETRNNLQALRGLASLAAAWIGMVQSIRLHKLLCIIYVVDRHLTSVYT